MSPHLLVTIFAALIAAILSGLGVGSAGLYVLYLTMIAGYGQAEAQGLNLIFFALSGGAALLVHLRDRRIPWRVVGILALCALPGAAVGTGLIRVLDPALLRRLFGGMLIVTGLPVLLRRASPRAADSAPPSHSQSR